MPPACVFSGPGCVRVWRRNNRVCVLWAQHEERACVGEWNGWIGCGDMQKSCAGWRWYECVCCMCVCGALIRSGGASYGVCIGSLTLLDGHTVAEMYALLPLPLLD